MKLSFASGVFAAGLLLFGSLKLEAQLIDVDFNANSLAVSGGGPTNGPTMTGAAVLGAAGDHWNGIGVTNGTAIPLIYANGNVSPVTMTFTAGGGYDVYSYSGTTPFAGTAYDALMQDYLYNGGVQQTITLSGLATNSMYNVVLYNAANTSAAGRTTYFTVNGITNSSTWNGSSSNLISGVDYVGFPTALSDASGNLVIDWTGNGTAEGDIDGFQIQTVPLTLNVTYPGPGVSLSFATRSGFSYQVQFKNHVSDANWTSLGPPIPGNNSVMVVNDLAGGASRFYRVQASVPAVPPNMLHTLGTTIVNASNAVVQLKGLNLGGWFIMEKWMCPLDSSNLPDTYSVITNLDARFGVATEQSLIKTYQTNWITTTDLDNITNAGFNCVRMPVWWGNFYSITNTTSSGWRTDAFDVLDWLVTNCASRGIYVVIDMHGVVGSQSVNGDTGQQNLNQYWTSATDQTETSYMWTRIASRYNGNPAVAGYDLINEPDNAPSSAAVISAYTNLYTTVRAVDPTHIIFIEGTWGNWDWSMLPAPSTYGWANIVYSMHEYQFGASTNMVEAGSDNQVADFNNHKSWNVPDWVGEWNDMGNGAACYQYSINDYNNDGISWCMWAYKATDGLLPDGWGWYDPTYWPTTPNIQADQPSTISSDWQQWRTTTSFGQNAAVGL